MPHKSETARKAYQRDYYARNRARRLANQKRYYDRHPEKNRAWSLFRLYGITEDQYDTKLAEQGGVCAICGEACPTGRRLAVDHSHATKKVRGLLCSKCNPLLGYAQDSVERLERAIVYLRKNQG